MTELITQAKPPAAQMKPRAVFSMIAVMAAASLALLPLLADDTLLRPFALSLWMVLALTGATELAAVHRHGRDHTHTLSLSEITLVICLVFAAPGDLVLGRAIAGLVVYGLYRRLPILKVGFNTMMFVLETTAATVVYRAVLGTGSPTDPIGWAAALLAILAATTVGLVSVRVILALHGERLGSSETRGTTILSLAMTGVGTGVGILAVGALWLHTSAFAVVGVVVALLYAGLRAYSDSFEAERQRSAVLLALDSAEATGDAVGVAVMEICRLLRVEHAEIVVRVDGECLRTHCHAGGLSDTALIRSDRCDRLCGAISGQSVMEGKGIPTDIALELASRGFTRPVVVSLVSAGTTYGYLAAGSKRAPARRLSSADRHTLQLVAERLVRNTVLI